MISGKRRQTPCAIAIAIAFAVTALACTGTAAEKPAPSEAGSTLVGRLLLPPGEGSRGVEVIVTVEGEARKTPTRTWLLFDEEGRFEHDISGRLTEVSVSTGLRFDLHRIAAADLPSADRDGRLDIGSIDLREKLQRHRLELRAADGAAHGPVRVAVCFGPPPVGPAGEPISLGSRQFPPIELGGETEWLLPVGAEDVYFLVERPVGSGEDLEWLGGYQRLFGPYDTGALPSALVMDEGSAPLR